jgi:hypothetical protein
MALALVQVGATQPDRRGSCGLEDGLDHVVGGKTLFDGGRLEAGGFAHLDVEGGVVAVGEGDRVLQRQLAIEAGDGPHVKLPAAHGKGLLRAALALAKTLAGQPGDEVQGHSASE